MARFKISLRTIVCCSLLAVIAAVAAYLYVNPLVGDKLYFTWAYDNVRPLDPEGRCWTFELKEKDKSVSNKPKIIKIYDTHKRKFLTIDPRHDITSIKEIRPGYYALLGKNGLQYYSIVMPYVQPPYSSYFQDGTIQIIDCIDWDNVYDHRDEEQRLPYDIAEAETQLIEQYEAAGQCGSSLIDYVKGRTATLDYDFSRLSGNTEVAIHTSPDKKLRLYSWDSRTGGTSPTYAVYVQYDNGRSITVDGYYPFSNSQYVCVADCKKDGYEASAYHDQADIQNIYQIEGTDTPYYIVVSAGRASSREGGQGAHLLTVKGGKLIKLKAFEYEGEMLYSMGPDYDIPDWYFTTDGMGWDWVMSFDKSSNTLYVPASESLEMTDRYALFQWQDGKMKYIGTDGGYWLHPTLRNFKRLCGIYQTKAKLIRIDEMEDGTYRYASWRKGKEMSAKPELVIVGTQPYDVDNALRFVNGEYEYIVPAFRDGSDKDFDKVIIKKNGKTISESEV